MEFRLIYGGVLLGASRSDTRSQHKDEIRKIFHAQLKHLWAISPNLKHWVRGDPYTSAQHCHASRYQLNGVSFIPLVTDDLGVGVKLDILMLRPDKPGLTLMRSGDIDNRLKTVFDALRIPQVGERFDVEDNPCFCLMQNDSLVNHVSVTTDALLGSTDENDVRLIITVNIWPIVGNMDNMGVF